MASERVEAWKAIQEQMRRQLIVKPLKTLPRYVAGCDVAFSRDKTRVIAAAVVYDRVEQTIIEKVHAIGPVEVPYIPGYLSFREGPTLLKAIAKLEHPWGVLCCDGQGIAHPRRCGLATHVAITLDVPAVGVAKSRLFGTHGDVPEAENASVRLMDGDEQIGLVLRSKANTRPLFISIGHRIDLESACRLVLACRTRYRFPEPTRQADRELARIKLEL